MNRIIVIALINMVIVVFVYFNASLLSAGIYLIGTLVGAFFGYDIRISKQRGRKK